jgi:hypothetical protein
MTDRKYGYDRTTKRWSDLDAGDYVIGKDGDLWRILEVHANGSVSVMGGPRDETALWRAQPIGREVPIAILHPVDPVAMMRDMLGATPIAWKRHDDDTWLAAPWPAALPGNHPGDDYIAHLKEWHGLRHPGKVEWDDLVKMHEEHHTPGITHPVKHTHPAPRLGQ